MTFGESVIKDRSGNLFNREYRIMADTTADVGDDENAPAKKGGKKKLIMIIVGALFVLGIGGGAGAYFMGMFDSAVPMENAEVMEPAAPKIAYKYYDIPEMLINLQADSGQVRYLKLLVSVEYEEGIDVATILGAQTQIEDLFQTYLRELTPTELQGSMGVFRLREELLKRINLIISPERINGILFKKIVVQ